MRTEARTALLVLVCLLSSTRLVTAGLNPNKQIGQYVRTVWEASSGLPQNSVQAVLQTRDGYVWLGTEEGLVRFDGERFEVFNRTNTPELPGLDVKSLFEAPDGSLWIGMVGGLAQLKDGRFTAFSFADGLPHDWISAVSGDRAGNVLLGTFGGGLLRFKNGRSTAFISGNGLPDNFVWAVTETRDGSIWIGTQNGGLNRVKDGRVVSVFSERDGLPEDTVTALLERADGGIWIGTAAVGLARLDGGRISVVRPDLFQTDSIRALFEGRDGALWVGTTGRGLKILRNGRVSVWDAKAGLSDVVRSFYEDPHGTVWVGSDAGLSRYVDGRFETFGVAQGVFRKGVMTISGDPDGTIWAGTLGDGLYRYKDGAFTHYSTANGLFDDIVFQIVDDQHGNLWMTCNRGVFKVSKQMLIDLAEHRVHAIVSASFGAADGMRGAECNGNAQPAGIRAHDGTLWFPTIKGVVSVSPDRLVVNRLPPPVVIERLVADRRRVVLSGDIRVPAGHGELEFHYTALSFADPAQVRFKYRLVGFDRDWIDAGRRREAHYTNLPAGSYQFQVAAHNNDGVWNEQGSTVSVRLEPHFYETILFYVAVAVAVAIAIGGLFRLRVHRMRQQAVAFEQIVDERTRALREEVSERRRAEEALRAAKVEAELADRAKGQFLANMSHEIRTPMNGIIGMTGLALSTTLTVEQREYLDMVQHSADALLTIIGDILDFSKIESGRFELDLAPFALRPTLREALNPLVLRAREKGLEFALDVDPSVPDTLVGDQGRLRQVLINLVANAIKFTRLGSVTVTVDAGTQDDQNAVVHFAIADTGIGIAPEKHALIFEPFRQADGSTTREFGGTGLGLAICRTLVEVFGGRIWLESSASGTTFHFTAPLAKGAPASVEAPRNRPDEQEQPRARLRVLLAEDNRVNQMLAKRLLERWGHEVVVAETGGHAVEAHAQQKFDVILMDVQMPGMNGFEATAAIRAAEGTSKGGTPIIAMTAHAMKGDRERCLAEGMDDYVSKPIDRAILFDVIERVMTSQISPARCA